MTRVVVMGEPMVGLIADDLGALADSTGFRAEVVGTEINTACGLARLGVPTVVIARTGTDELGEMVLRHALREGIDARFIRRVDQPPGGLIRSRRAFGATSVVYRRAGSAASTLDRTDVRAAAETIAGSAWFHVTGVTAALSDSCRAAIDEAFAIAAASGVTTSFDLNYRSRLWSPDAAVAAIRPLVARADVTLTGDSEGRTLTGASTPEDLVAALRSWGAREVVIKRGDRGAYLDRAGVVTERPARVVAGVVDDVGAGDAFAAGLIAARVLGHDDGTALEWGNTVAAFCVSTIGDARGLPSLPELERALRADGDETVR